MSCSKPLPPFAFDLLCYLNRDQLERFSIVCRPLKNFIERYFHSKPWRIFDRLYNRGGSYALRHNLHLHNFAQWHPNRDDYSVQQFLDGQQCSIDESKRPWSDPTYYSFVEMRQYLGPTVRIKRITISISGDSTYIPEQIKEMESIAYLWRDGVIYIENARNYDSRIGAEDFPLILNSPKILQCRKLFMDNANFSFKDYKVLYTVSVLEITYNEEEEEIDSYSWLEFFDQPGVKPIAVLRLLRRESIDNLLKQLSEAFTSAISPNAFKVIFAQYGEELAVFRKTNSTSTEMLELKKGFPAEYQNDIWKGYDHYTLERSSI